MGPVIFITGNPRSEAPSRVPGPSSGFNGAGDLHHRKLDGLKQLELRIHPASMGPVIFITGNNTAQIDAFATKGLQWGR